MKFYILVVCTFLFFVSFHQELQGASYARGELPVVDKQKFQTLFDSLDHYVQQNGISNNSKTTTRIFLVRHGQSTANALGINAGQTVDVDLTEEGIKQAEAAGNVLFDKVDEFSAVYVTPLKRTQQTFDAIARLWLKQHRTLPSGSVVKELIEQHNGSMEGVLQKERESYKLKEEIDISSLKRFEDKFSYKMVPDQESLADVYERAEPALLKIAQEHLGENVLVVTHVGVLRALTIGAVASLPEPLAIESPSLDIPNAAIIMLESDGKIIQVKATNGLKFKH